MLSPLIWPCCTTQSAYEMYRHKQRVFHPLGWGKTEVHFRRCEEENKEIWLHFHFKAERDLECGLSCFCSRHVCECWQGTFAWFMGGSCQSSGGWESLVFARHALAVRSVSWPLCLNVSGNRAWTRLDSQNQMIGSKSNRITRLEASGPTWPLRSASTLNFSNPAVMTMNATSYQWTTARI